MSPLTYANSTLERVGRGIFLGHLYGGTPAGWLDLGKSGRAFYKNIAQDALDAYLEEVP